MYVVLSKAQAPAELTIRLAQWHDDERCVAIGGKQWPDSASQFRNIVELKAVVHH